MTASPPIVFPDAAATDPVRLGWMRGFPPPPEKTIAFADGSLWAFPRTRWAFSHMRELFPTANVSRGDGPVAVLPRAEQRGVEGLRAVEVAHRDLEPVDGVGADGRGGDHVGLLVVGMGEVAILRPGS